jgi:D-alanyl-D-alanine carboxypeptidase
MIVKYGLESEQIGEEFAKIISADSYDTGKTNKHEDGITLSSIFKQRYSGYFIDRDEDGESDADIFGGKTGYTTESGYSLASVYKVDGEYYVCVTMKSENTASATEDNVAIAERYLPTYDLITDITTDTSSEDTSSISLVDATPEPIDQTDSDLLTSSSESDDTSSD